MEITEFRHSRFIRRLRAPAIDDDGLSFPFKVVNRLQTRSTTDVDTREEGKIKNGRWKEIRLVTYRVTASRYTRLIWLLQGEKHTYNSHLTLQVFSCSTTKKKKSFTQSKRHLAANKREKILSSQVIKAILATFLNNERCLEITESKKKIHLCDKMAMPFKRTRSPHNVGYLVATNQWRPRNSLKSHDLYRFESERCVISSGRPLGVPKETTFPSSHGQHLVVTVFLSAAEIFCCLIIFLIEKPREFGKHDVKPSSNNR